LDQYSRETLARRFMALIEQALNEKMLGEQTSDEHNPIEG